MSLGSLSDDLAAEKSKTANLSAMLESESAKGSSAGSTAAGLQTMLDKEKSLSSDALARVELLNQQIAAMRRQLQSLNALLSDSETRNKSSDAQIESYEAVQEALRTYREISVLGRGHPRNRRIHPQTSQLSSATICEHIKNNGYSCGVSGRKAENSAPSPTARTNI